MPQLIHCIYSSASTIEFTQTEFMQLLETARRVNAALDISGILLYEDKSFFQVLEGPPKAVKALYEKIGRDKRHYNVIKIIEEPIGTRSFSEWTMGYAGVTRKELQDIEGLNDFFSTQRCYIDLDQNRAKTLLEAFKSGKWRAAIE